jgi:hypothetical protein
MPFIAEILKQKSLAVVGLEKNCGKTECLNYILERIPAQSCRACITSIGIDGESIDQVTRTKKPEIVLKEGNYFSTSESHYRLRNLTSEIVGISNETTALGRIITARVVSKGKVILSGPSSTQSLRRWMDETEHFGIDLTIIDGALSRISSASPAVSTSMILATGAALSSNMATLIAKTAFAVDMIHLPLYDSSISDFDTNAIELSSLSGDHDISPDCRRVYVSGALTDRLLKKLLQEKNLGEMELVVKDFTRIFITPQTYNMWVRYGGKLRVQMQSNLLAVCVNPLSPSGYVLDSDTLCRELSARIALPVYDIVKNKYEA